jgi:hypothetical protein
MIIGCPKLTDGSSSSEWRLGWICLHKILGRDMTYEIDTYSPTRGWALKPGLHNFTFFDNKTVNSNSNGIRGTAEYSYDRTLGKPRILILGDSFTFGDECSDHETYPYQLQEMMPEAEIMNLGVHGYGHDQMLIYLREEGLKYNPDIVILGFMPGDMERNMLSFRDYAKPRFELVDGELILRNSPVPAPEDILKNEAWRLRFIDSLDIIRHGFLKKIGWYGRKQFELSMAILEEIARVSEKHNARPVFLYLKNARDAESFDAIPQEERYFLEYWQSKGVACISFQQDARDEYKLGIKFKMHGHFGPVTNRIIAAGIKKYLSVDHNLYSTQLWQ